MRFQRSSTLLLSAGNFFSSLAGGLVLAKGLNLVSGSPYAFADSVLAYLIGSSLSFGAILWLRQRGNLFIWPFSSSAAVLSLGLAPLFAHGVIADRGSFILLFALLCLFFACTFIPRALRSDLAASRGQALTLVELAYSAGYLTGLLVTRLSFFPQKLGLLGLAVAALTDVAFRFLDKRNAATVGARPTEVRIPAVSGVLVQGVLLFFALTAGVQIGIQRLASLTGAIGPLVVFEIGVTLAPLLCLCLSLRLESRAESLAGSRMISEKFPESSLAFPFGAGAILILMGFGVIFHSHPAGLFFLTLASCGYEALSLLLLQWLGRTPGAVAAAFAANGLLCSTLYAALLFAPGGMLLVTLLVGAAISLAAISFRAPRIFSRKNYFY